VNHVGKLYQIAAQRIAEALTAEIGGVVAAECCLTSQIGHPIDDPQVVDLALELEDGSTPASCAPEAEHLVHRELERLRSAWRDVVL